VTVFSVTSLELIHHKIINVPWEQLSAVSRQSGSSQEVDLGGHGSVPLNSTSKRTIWTSTRHESAHRTVQNGVNFWRRLCSLKGAPPDDDDNDEVGDRESSSFTKYHANCVFNCRFFSVIGFLIFVRRAFTGYANSDVSGECLTPKQWRHSFMLSWHPMWIVDYCNAVLAGAPVWHEQAATNAQRGSECCQRQKEAWSRPDDTYPGRAILTWCYRLSRIQALFVDAPVSTWKSSEIPRRLLHARLWCRRSATFTVCQLPAARRTTTSVHHTRQSGIRCNELADAALRLRAQQNSDCFGCFLKIFLSVQRIRDVNENALYKSILRITLHPS